MNITSRTALFCTFVDHDSSGGVYRAQAQTFLESLFESGEWEGRVILFHECGPEPVFQHPLVTEVHITPEWSKRVDICRVRYQILASYDWSAFDWVWYQDVDAVVRKPIAPLIEAASVNDISYPEERHHGPSFDSTCHGGAIPARLAEAGRSFFSANAGTVICRGSVAKMLGEAWMSCDVPSRDPAFFHNDQSALNYVYAKCKAGELPWKIGPLPFEWITRDNDRYPGAQNRSVLFHYYGCRNPHKCLKWARENLAHDRAVRAHGTKVFTHCGDRGDILASLPVIKAFGGGELLMQESERTRVRFTAEVLKTFAPLLEAQPYLARVGMHAGEPVFRDLGAFRAEWRIAKRSKEPAWERVNITEWHRRVADAPAIDYSEPWLTVPDPKRVARVVFNRTPRYSGDPSFWLEAVAKHRGEAVFVGTPKEHETFCRDFGAVPYVGTADYLELAQVIAGAEQFYGNQSSAFWIADGLKLPTVVECWPEHPNCLIDRPNFRAMWPGEALDQTSAERLREFRRTRNDPDPVAGRHFRAPQSLLSERRYDPNDHSATNRLWGLSKFVEAFCFDEDRKAAPRGHLVEVGTYRGVSTQLFAEMLPGWSIWTFDPMAQPEASARLAPYEYVKMIRASAPGCAAECGDGSIDILYLDSIHTYEQLSAEIRAFFPKMAVDGIIAGHGFQGMFPGVIRAVEEAFGGPPDAVFPDSTWAVRL